jgi:hypothetical protein
MDRTTVEVKYTAGRSFYVTSLANLYEVPLLPPAYGFQTYLMYPCVVEHILNPEFSALLERFTHSNIQLEHQQLRINTH